MLRTTLPTNQMNTGDVVRAYKNLANVERDFRSLRTFDVDLRPIHHYTETVCAPTCSSARWPLTSSGT